jgi:hypothetical protein
LKCPETPYPQTLVETHLAGHEIYPQDPGSFQVLLTGSGKTLGNLWKRSGMVFPPNFKSSVVIWYNCIVFNKMRYGRLDAKMLYVRL